MIAKSGAPSHPHIYELDPLRSLTALAVVAVHVLFFTSGFYSNAAATTIQFGLLDTVHWTRDVFLAITAFVLTYVYYGRPFSARSFWSKRSLGVLLPYVLWSLAYSWANNPVHEPVAFAKTAFVQILTGTASYQLYYILLTLQIYIVLPLFLALLKRIARHPWRALAISFALELVTMHVLFQYLQQGPLASSSLGQSLFAFANGFLLTYQFYVILGGLGALYMDRVRAFLSSHGKWAIGAFVFGLGVALADYAFEIWVHHMSPVLASAVLQPVIIIYSLGVIVFLYWLGWVWASRAKPGKEPPGYGFWHLLSDATFGIYLVQAFVLTAVFTWVFPKMPNAWPTGLRVLMIWVLTAGGSAFITIVFLNLPIASRLVGRPSRWPRRERATALQQGLSNRIPHETKVEANQ